MLYPTELPDRNFEDTPGTDPGTHAYKASVFPVKLRVQMKLLDYPQSFSTVLAYDPGV